MLCICQERFDTYPVFKMQLENFHGTFTLSFWSVQGCKALKVLWLDVKMVQSLFFCKLVFRRLWMNIKYPSPPPFRGLVVVSNGLT
jgi:hypothetical protein